MHGKTWFELPFFDLEFLFYHALNGYAGHFADGYDLFARSKSSATQEALVTQREQMEQVLLAQPGREQLWFALVAALRQNQADLSQMGYLSDQMPTLESSLLLDQRLDLITRFERLSSPPVVHVLLDNAGRELCWDLILVDALLSARPETKVTLHAKPWPMFVSDASRADVEFCMKRMGDAQPSAPLRCLSERLERAVRAGRLEMQARPDWGEPRDFSGLSDGLGTELAQAGLVLAKGDLNYRRFVADRAWAFDTPVEQATAQVPFFAYCLRVLKSEAVVGLAQDVVERARSIDPEWATSGRFTMVQRLGLGAARTDSCSRSSN
jgi:hypothetical protein